MKDWATCAATGLVLDMIGFNFALRQQNESNLLNPVHFHSIR